MFIGSSVYYVFSHPNIDNIFRTTHIRSKKITKDTALSFKTTSIILVILRKTIIFAHSDAGSTASGVSFYRSYKIIFVGGNQMRQRPFFDFRLNFRYAKIRFILLICNILRA